MSRARNARVRPDAEFFDDGFFFDVNARADNRIGNFLAFGLMMQFSANDRAFNDRPPLQRLIRLIFQSQNLLSARSKSWCASRYLCGVPMSSQ